MPVSALPATIFRAGEIAPGFLPDSLLNPLQDNLTGKAR